MKITELFLVTQEIFDQTKTSEKVPMRCSICSKDYYKTKKDILQHNKRQKNSNLYCSSLCKGEAFSKKQELSCTYCHTLFKKKESEITSDKNFCSRSCSASFSNKRKRHTDISKQKLSDSLKNHYNNLNNQLRVAYSANPNTCKVCFTELAYEKRNSKTCKKECTNTLNSLIMKSKIEQGYNPQKHRGRKKSYLEKSFKEWLENFEIKFTEEHPIKIYENNTYKTCFFIDFYFHELQLGIELDGTQHKKTIDKDIERDRLIFQQENIKIFRITHKEYTQKTKIEEVKKLLNI